jgi:hypothetical protein
MRPLTRGFTVEIKARRRSIEPAMTASLVSRDSWADLIPPDDLPGDVYADLVDAPPNEARRRAEKLFGRFVADQKPVPTKVASEAPVPTVPDLVAPVRFLPDLLAVAREEERRAGEAPKQKRAKGAATTKPRKKSERARIHVGVRVIDPPAQPSGMLNGRAEAALALSRRSKAPASKLPPGQRWRERRLPRVCWDRGA